MVDLGWPWWVTTTIAACVAAARRPRLRAPTRACSARGFRGARSPGVAIAVIAPFVMDDGASGASAMRQSSDAGAMLSRAEFARRADGNCAAVNTRVARLGAWPAPADLRATAAFLDDVIPIVESGVRDQGTLRAPPGEKRTAAAWMHSMAAVGKGLDTARESAKAGDHAGVRAGYRASDAASARSAALSKQLGLKICFS
jgi:hypothetical protein